MRTNIEYCKCVWEVTLLEMIDESKNASKIWLGNRRRMSHRYGKEDPENDIFYLLDRVGVYTQD